MTYGKCKTAVYDLGQRYPCRDMCSECTALKCSRGNISVLDSTTECKGDGEKEGEDRDEAEWEKGTHEVGQCVSVLLCLSTFTFR